MSTLRIVAQQAGGKEHVLVLPCDATVVQLEAAVRAAAGLGTQRRLALTVDDCAPAPTTAIADLVDMCKRDDGLLHVTYSAEAIMGWGIGPSGGILPNCTCGWAINPQ